MNTTSQPVAVICAMEAEAVHLRRRLDHAREKPLYAWRRTYGKVAGNPVELIVSGIGLIEAAAAATAVCLETEPVAVFNYGCAGTHRADIELQSRTAMRESDGGPALLEPVRDEIGLRASRVVAEVIRHLS